MLLIKPRAPANRVDACKRWLVNRTVDVLGLFGGVFWIGFLAAFWAAVGWWAVWIVRGWL